MLKVALLSGWHVHTGGYAKFIQEQPDAKLTVIWDDDEARGKEWAERLGIDYESDLSKMLAREDVDAVLCDAPTNDHCALLVQCAKAKKHIFTEKALAPTVQECEEIATAVRDAGVKFVISFPGSPRPLCNTPSRRSMKAAWEKLLTFVSVPRTAERARVGSRTIGTMQQKPAAAP